MGILLAIKNLISQSIQKLFGTFLCTERLKTISLVEARYVLGYNHYCTKFYECMYVY